MNKILEVITAGAMTITIPDAMLGDAWLASSSLQKSIRRNELNRALAAGRSLWQQSRTTFWRRIMTASLEDVGVASADTVIQVLTAYVNPEWRNQIGDLRIGLYLIRLMCRSMKSRFADEIYIAADKLTDYRDIRASFSGATPDKLAQIVLNIRRPIHTRTLALWMLTSPARFPSVGLPDRKGSPETVLDVLQELGGELDLIHRCVDVLYKTQWPLALFLPLLASYVGQMTEPLTEGKDEISVCPEYEGVPHVCVDRFTRVGQTCIRQFQKAIPELKPFTHEQIGIGLFYVEGGRVDRALMNDTLRYYKQCGEIAELQGAGLIGSGQDDLRGIILGNVDIMAQIRHRQLVQYFHGSQLEMKWTG